jgi:hypothetical protein
MKKEKSGIEECNSVDGKLRKNAQATLPNEQAVAAFPCIQHILDANRRTWSWSLTAPATLPSEENVAAFPCIQHILDANRRTRCWQASRLSICELHPRQSTTRTNMGPNHRHAKEMQEMAST